MTANLHNLMDTPHRRIAGRGNSARQVPFRTVYDTGELRHAFVKRLIGTIRRKRLDRTSFWNAVELARKLGAFRDYDNGHRVHRVLEGATPAKRAGAPSLTNASLDGYS